MSEWKEKILSELGFTYAGLSGKTQKDFGRGKPFIPFMNIMSNGKIDPKFMGYVDVASNERQNVVQVGDLFFTTSSETPEEVGMTSVLLEDIGECYLNSFCFGFRLYNFDDLLPEFATYLFRGNVVRKQIINLGQGYTRFNLPKTELLKKLKLKLPSEPEQRKISEILTKSDSIIEKTQAAIAKYQAIKQGMLQDVFTRGIDTTTGALRPRYDDAPHLYKESPLGWIPREWEVDCLGSIIDAVDPQPDHRTPHSVENGVPYLGINDMDKYGNIDLTKCRKVSDEILAEHKKRYTIRMGDIMFGKIGTIGEPKRLLNFDNITLSANVILIQPKCVADYIYWLLCSQLINGQVKKSIHATSQPAFGIEKIRALIVPICDEIEQGLISQAINSCDTKLRTEQAYLEKLQALKKGLMEDLLTGKVRVAEEVMQE